MWPESRIPLAVVMTSFHPGGTEHQMIELIRRLDRRRWAMAAALGDAARARVAQTYSFDRMVAAMEAIYEAELVAYRHAATFRSKHTRAEPRERVTGGAWRPASIE